MREAERVYKLHSMVNKNNLQHVGRVSSGQSKLVWTTRYVCMPLCWSLESRPGPPRPAVTVLPVRAAAGVWDQAARACHWHGGLRAESWSLRLRLSGLPASGIPTNGMYPVHTSMYQYVPVLWCTMLWYDTDINRHKPVCTGTYFLPQVCTGMYFWTHVCTFSLKYVLVCT